MALIPQYRAEFGRCRSDRMGISRIRKISGALGSRCVRTGAYLTPRKTPLPTGVAAANLFLVGQTVWASVGGGVLKTSRNTSLHTGVIVILGQKVDA